MLIVIFFDPNVHCMPWHYIARILPIAHIEFLMYCLHYSISFTYLLTYLLI